MASLNMDYRVLDKGFAFDEAWHVISWFRAAGAFAVRWRGLIHAFT